MKVLSLLAATGMLLAQMQFASAGNINPMSQRYNAKSFARGAKPKPAQTRPPQRRRRERAPGAAGPARRAAGNTPPRAR